MISKNQKSELQRMSPERREVSIDENRTQHVRLVFAMHRLEACLGQAATGREDDWHEQVNHSLDLLIAAMSESRDCVCSDDGLIEEVKLEKPHLLSRIGNLRAEFDGLFNQAKSLQSQVNDFSESPQIAVSDLRQRMDWLVSGLKHHQAKESDLVYEAINVDLGVGD